MFGLSKRHGAHGQGQTLNGSDGSALSKMLITYHHPKSPVSEAFRTLRTNLHYASPEKVLRLLGLTSAGPEEGKSVVTANLAITLAQQGKKVLLMDCDLRKPMVHKLFGVPSSPGITNVLVDGTPLDTLASKAPVQGLTVIPAGPIPPNPSELLGSSSMDQLLQEVSERFDYVLLDTPPVVSVTDAVVLSSRLDGLILVVHAGVTRTQLVKEAKKNIEQAQGNLIGVVLNGVRYSSGDYRYYYYYSHGYGGYGHHHHDNGHEEADS